MSTVQGLDEDPNDLEGPDLRSQLEAGDLGDFTPPKLPDGVKDEIRRTMEEMIPVQDIGQS